MIIRCLVCLILICVLPCGAQTGIADEQRRERQELDSMRSEVSDIKSTINDAMQQLNRLTNQLQQPDIKEVHLFARQSDVSVSGDTRVTCWTYNGKIPGPELRVKQGQMVRVVIHNQLPTATSLTFHGLPVPDKVGGLPRSGAGLLKPGETYAYQFVAEHPGTYWYHPQIMHHDQRSRGMFGALIIEPVNRSGTIIAPDKDIVVFLSDLLIARKPGAKTSPPASAGSAAKQGAPASAGSAAKQGAPASAGSAPKQNAGGAAPAKSTAVKANSQADAQDEPPPADLEALSFARQDSKSKSEHIYLMNGRTAPSIAPLEVGRGQRIKLRIINAGQSLVPLSLTGHRLEVSSVNGADMLEPHVFRDTLSVQPADRIDVEFSADNPGIWSFGSELAEQASRNGKFPGGIACMLRYFGADKQEQP